MTAHILVVDDEIDVQELFRQNFRRELRAGTYGFEFAGSGTAALERLRSQARPEVLMVLSDINMPGMSGIDLLQQVRRAWPAMGVVMISAYGDSATAARTRELGAACFLSKPVDFSALKQKLTRLVAATRC